MGAKGNCTAIIQAGLGEPRLHPRQRPRPHQRGPEREAQHRSPSPVVSLEPSEFPDKHGAFPAAPEEPPRLIHHKRHHRCYVRNGFCWQRSVHQLPPAVQVLVACQPPASCKGLAMQPGEDRGDSAHACSIPPRRQSRQLTQPLPLGVTPPGLQPALCSPAPSGRGPFSHQAASEPQGPCSALPQCLRPEDAVTVWSAGFPW